MTDIKEFQQTKSVSVRAPRKKNRTIEPSALRVQFSKTFAAASDQGLKILDRGVKEFVQIVQKFRHLSIEDFGLSSPKIVAIGNQSMKKSSSIEDISEIKVPRDILICSRCTLEMNLKENLNENEG